MANNPPVKITPINLHLVVLVNQLILNTLIFQVLDHCQELHKITC